jgi:predicted RND superfamily exporter protein
MIASVGMGLVFVTSFILLPVTLSYLGVSRSAAKRAVRIEEGNEGGTAAGAWEFLNNFTERRWAVGIVSAAAVLAVVGVFIGSGIQVGDLDPGAPELRPDSRYNMDNAYITSNYGTSSDVFTVIMKTAPDMIWHYEPLVKADRLVWELEHMSEVQGTDSLSSKMRQMSLGGYEGNFKWYNINRSRGVLGSLAHQAVTQNPSLSNDNSSITPIDAYLEDHKAATLDRVVKVVEEVAAQVSGGEDASQFLLAAGSAGIEAATNIAIRKANVSVLLYIYASVIILCYVTFRSWGATAVAVIPLVLTSVLCQALMVMLGIGIKVSTLPVTALGVGIGVDYALYLLSVQLAYQRTGLSLRESYGHAVKSTGKVVALVGLTLACGVATWAWSPIKFQADMGILLAFMFFYNMIGALVLVPALSHFLLRKV